MNCTERTMATMTIDLPVSWTVHVVKHNVYEDYRSEELNRLIDEDYRASRTWDDDYLKDWEPFGCGISEEERDLLNPPDALPEAFSIMVDPRTALLVKHPFKRAESSKKHLELSVESKELPKPYHWSQDHDYWKKMEEKDDDESDMKSSGLDIIEKMFNSEDEPVVEVWEIDNFCKKPREANPVSQQLTSCRQTFKKETRRTSTRTAEIKRREQARKISTAVHAVLKNNKARRIRQYKNIKPKNSVETTPSQSDIEEWCSQPVRPTYTKITKKKTSKGRIDHSESERHRREVLRRNFSSLSDLIPTEYLRGEKVSSQISKQKILNGAKAYIVKVNSARSSYKSQYRQNRLLRERWQKKSSSKLLKYVKKQK